MMSSDSLHNIVGVLPAAGIGSRLGPNRYPKELLPIGLWSAPDASGLRPSLIIEHSLRALSRASITKCCVVISPIKTEIVRYLGDGHEYGISLAYFAQEQPRGLAVAIDSVYPWVRDKQVCLSLPDTVFEPPDAICSLREQMQESGADLVLGVFPTDKPEQLGPVRLEASGRVVEVLDKPKSTDVRNTWGVALWSPAFTELLHEFMAAKRESRAEVVLGHAFQLAVVRGLDVRGVFFADGRYIDAGTPEGIASVVKMEPDW